MSHIEKLMAGNQHFKDVKFKKHEKKLRQSIIDGQSPKALFIGCSDSRVLPMAMTSATPGDLFVVRNIGNFVAPYKPDEDYHSTASAIEYAVSVLKVGNIIVCGHSHCGACEALYKDISAPELVHTKKWLELGEPAKEYVKTILPHDASDREKYRLTEKISVVFQMQNLLTYPAVAKAVDEGTLAIHGWYYKIGRGEIEYYDVDEGNFKPFLSGNPKEDVDDE